MADTTKYSCQCCGTQCTGKRICDTCKANLPLFKTSTGKWYPTFWDERNKTNGQ